MITAGLQTPTSTKNGEKGKERLPQGKRLQNVRRTERKVRSDYRRAKDTKKYEERRKR